MKNEARDCEFEHLTDSLIRDRIMCGITDDQVRGCLLREPDLMLNKAIDICRASELSQSQLKSLHEEVEIPVHKVTKQKTTQQKEIQWSLITEYKDEKSRELHQMWLQACALPMDKCAKPATGKIIVQKCVIYQHTQITIKCNR